MPIPNLSGYTLCRNAVELDYPVNLTIESLLAICAEVVVCDSDSTDGTREMLDAIARNNGRVRVINYPWPNPKGDSKWFTEWINFARLHLSLPMQLELDADEVLSDHPLCHFAIQGACTTMEPRTFNRLNFWRDAHSLIPDGHCCGKWVTRLGPSNWWMPSDEPHHRGELPILDNARLHPDLVIFHLGFMRRQEAMYAKAKVVLEAFFNRYDPRLETAENEGKPIWESECEFTDQLIRFEGYYPEKVREWLTARGHAV